ncbi:MAG: GspH/FimT family pseudopilin [Gammaproteobacteria bacterium]|nr:GspH/FimT family pseudopilin [Gammaproteobacteria bacterium]
MVIALSVILLFSALISYRDFVSRHQLNALIDQLTDSLAFARDAAITMHTEIMFSPKNANWQNGYLILNDENQKRLRELPAIPDRYRFYWRSTLGDSGRLRWRSDGFTRGQQGSFFICGKTQSAQIILLRTGRWRVVRGKIAGCDDQSH